MPLDDEKGYSIEEANSLKTPETVNLYDELLKDPEYAKKQAQFDKSISIEEADALPEGISLDQANELQVPEGISLDEANVLEKPQGLSLDEANALQPEPTTMDKFLDIPKQLAIGGGLEGPAQMIKTGQELSEALPEQLKPEEGGVLDLVSKAPMRVIDKLVEKYPELSVQSVKENNPPLTIAGSFANDGAQFLSSFAPASAGLKVAGITNALLKATAAGAIADFSAFDPMEARLSNLLTSFDNPVLNNTVTQYLQADPNDTKMEGRLKQVLEGGALGALGEVLVRGMMSGFRFLKAKRTVESVQKPTVTDVSDTAANAKVKEVHLAQRRDRSLEEDFLSGRFDEPEPIDDIVDITDTTVLQRQANTVTGKLNNFVREAIDVSGGKAISYLDDLTTRSPTARILRNMIEATEFSPRALGADYTQRVTKQIGNYTTQIREAMRPLRSKLRGKVAAADEAEVVSGLRGGKVSARLKPVVASLRKITDSMYAYERTGEAGAAPGYAANAKSPVVDVGYTKDWFPRNYITEKLTKAQKAAGKISLKTEEGVKSFRRILKKYDIDDNQLSREFGLDGKGTEDIIENIQGLGEKADAKKGIVDIRKTGSELKRKLNDIPDQELAPFLHDDIQGSLEDYVQSMVQRVEVARIAGHDGKKLEVMLDSIRAESTASGLPMTQGEEKRIINIVDALQGNYKPIENKLIRTAFKYNSTYQAIRTLDLSLLSSLAEPFVVLMRGRADSSIRTIPKLFSHIATETTRMLFKGLDPAEATKRADALGLTLDRNLSERVSQISGAEVTKASDVFFKLIGLQQWTRLNRVWGVLAGERMILDNIDDLIKFEKSTGLATPMAKQKKHLGKLAPNKRFDELVELGIEPREAIDWKNAGKPKNHPFAQKLDDAIIRFTNEVVMSPRVANMPLLASRPSLQPIYQLKKFQITFGNTVVKRIAHQTAKRGAKEGAVNAAKAASIMGLMTFTAMLSNKIREWVDWGEEGNPRFKNETSQAEMLRGFDRAGFTGIAQIGIDMGFAHRFGNKPGVVRALGPTINQLYDLTDSALEASRTGNSSALDRDIVEGIPGFSFNRATRKGTREFLFGEPQKNRSRRSRARGSRSGKSRSTTRSARSSRDNRR